MSNLYILLKSSFVNNTGINSLSKGISTTKEKKKLLFTTMTLVLLAVAMCFVSTTYSIAMAMALKPMGYLDLILIVAVIACTLISFITSIYKAQGTLFSANDYNLLMALPIKSSTILTSKIISMMAINYLTDLFILLPASIVYFIYNGELSWMFFLILAIALIFVPMIPIVASSIVAVIVTFISSRFKYKNIATTIVGMGAFLLIMLVSLNTQNFINEFIANSETIIKGVSSIYPPALFFKEALINYDLVSLLKFIVVSIIPFIVFILVFSKTFKAINGKLSESFKKANYRVTELQINSPIKAITIQELRRYFATPIYVLNTALGMVLVLGASIATLFISPETLVMIIGYPGMEDVIPLMVLALFIFGIGLTCTTNSSISLEGNKLWIIKSLPISVIDIFKGKILMNLIITIPIGIISNIIFFIGLKFEVKYLLFNLLISIIYSILIAIVGLIINLYFPKMDWTNPTTVVKQSASVMITILGLLILTLAMIGISVALVEIFNITNMIIILTVVLILFLILLFASIKTLDSIGSEKFNRL